jgi:hypothetical protein
MQRLSSPSTFFYKRVFPAFWFGFLGIFIIPWTGIGFTEHTARLVPSLLMPLSMAIFGFVLFKRVIFDLVDEVWLDGEYLVVKNRREPTRIALRDVINVNASTMTNPPRITLMLRTESSRLGKTVSFMPIGPRGFFSAFRPNPVATDLIHRIDALRGRPA